MRPEKENHRALETQRRVAKSTTHAILRGVGDPTGKRIDHAIEILEWVLGEREKF